MKEAFNKYRRLDMPLISVIVPVYKVEKFLDRCIRSILNQTFRDFELIIVDDGSPDKCPAMCDEWKTRDERIVVVHQQNQGLSAARNSGIKIARGTYLTFVDSDDWISDDMLEILFNLIEKYNTDISICNFLKTDSEDNTLHNNEPKETVFNRDEFMDIILKINSNRTIHYAWAKLYKREIIDDEHYPVGMLNEDVEGMFKAVMRSEKIAETTAVGYYYYENNDSITRKKFGKNFLCLNEVWERVLRIAEKSAPEYKEKVIFNLKRTDFTILVDMLLYGDKETDVLYKENIDKIRKRLKKNIKYLLKGPMVNKRKILMILVCYFYLPIRTACRIR